MSVEVTLSSRLSSRAGVRRTYVAVPGDGRLADLVDRLVDRYGAEMRAALADGGSLRHDVVAVREGNVAEEQLTLESRVSPGDRIRFEVSRSEPTRVASEFSA
jgi:hypothetical protein